MVWKHYPESNWKRHEIELVCFSPFISATINCYQEQYTCYSFIKNVNTDLESLQKLVIKKIRILCKEVLELNEFKSYYGGIYFDYTPYKGNIGCGTFWHNLSGVWIEGKPLKTGGVYRRYSVNYLDEVTAKTQGLKILKKHCRKFLKLTESLN